MATIVIAISGFLAIHIACMIESKHEFLQAQKVKCWSYSFIIKGAAHNGCESLFFVGEVTFFNPKTIPEISVSKIDIYRWWSGLLSWKLRITEVCIISKTATKAEHIWHLWGNIFYPWTNDPLSFAREQWVCFFMLSKMSTLINMVRDENTLLPILIRGFFSTFEEKRWKTHKINKIKPLYLQYPFERSCYLWCLELLILTSNTFLIA